MASGPVNRPLEIFRAQDALPEVIPSTWHSSCTATDRKSFSLRSSPLVVVPKCQLTPRVSKVIDPPQGATSVPLLTPDSPRVLTVAFQAGEPLDWKPPAPPMPRLPGRSRPPA